MAEVAVAVNVHGVGVGRRRRRDAVVRRRRGKHLGQLVVRQVADGVVLGVAARRTLQLGDAALAPASSAAADTVLSVLVAVGRFVGIRRSGSVTGLRKRKGKYAVNSNKKKKC